jgi:uncharacterized membrane protein YvlD (DUF360 family)
MWVPIVSFSAYNLGKHYPSSALARKMFLVLIRLLVRIMLVTLAFVYVTPYVSGVKFHGDFAGALVTSLIFNAAFWGLECLLSVVVFGINIGTLGLGAFISNSLKFVAALLSPSLALFGAAKIMPGVLQIGNYFPSAIIYGFMLGGVLWASLPEKGK